MGAHAPVGTAADLIRRTLKDPAFATPEFDAVRRILKDPSAPDSVAAVSAHPDLERCALHLLNGPLLSCSPRLRSLQQAAAEVDPELLGTTVAVAFLCKALGADTRHRSDLSRLWVHHLAVAALAAVLADRVGCPRKDHAILGAWLHDVGRVILRRSDPKRFAEMVERIRVAQITRTEAETAFFGVSHTAVSRALASEIGLPPALIEITSDHHLGSWAGEDLPEAATAEGVPALAVVYLANFFAHTLGIESGETGPRGAVDLTVWASVGVNLATLVELLDDLEQRVNEMARAFSLRPVRLASFCRFLSAGRNPSWETAADRLREKLLIRIEDLARVGSELAPLARIADPEQVMEALVSGPLRRLRFDRKILYSVSGDGRTLLPVGSTGENAPTPELPVIPLSDEDEPVILALSRGQSWRLYTASTPSGSLLHQLGSAEVILVPIRSDQDALGLIIVDNFKTARPLDNIDRDVLAAISQQIGWLIENATLYKQLQDRARELGELSIRDGLTGAYNYRYFVQRLAEEVNRCRRRGESFSLMMLDLDRFKEFNDTYGHGAGNAALVYLVDCMRERLRVSDLVFRYGGEEFAVLLPQTPKQQARIPAEAVCHGLAETDLSGIVDHAVGEVRLTVSVGIAAYPEDGQTESEVLTKADRSLYMAKSQGRNCVALAP